MFIPNIFNLFKNEDFFEKKEKSDNFEKKEKKKK